MATRIILFDAQHPEEPLEAQVELCSQMELSLSIPNTNVRFKVCRSNQEASFEGSVGGRDFIYDPSKSRFAALFETSVPVNGT